MDFFFLEAHALMQNPPAHAGNTLDKNATVTIAQDHPRLRGEYNHIKIDGQEYLGSPPLARGIHFLRKQSEPEIPITPACAGNTYQRSPERSVLRDHPRLRGEYEQKSQGERLAKGSPPACAGNTIEIIQFRMKKKTGSPPLARGIHTTEKGRLCSPGSPPLTRGIRGVP